MNSNLRKCIMWILHVVIVAYTITRTVITMAAPTNDFQRGPLNVPFPCNSVLLEVCNGIIYLFESHVILTQNVPTTYNSSVSFEWIIGLHSSPFINLLVINFDSSSDVKQTTPTNNLCYSGFLVIRKTVTYHIPNMRTVTTMVIARNL